MAPVALAARVVEVIADLGVQVGGSAAAAGTSEVTPRYRYGSGCIVRGRTVLTAAHVVAGADTVQVRRPDKVLLPARVDPRFVADGSGPDLALVDIDAPGIDLPAMELAVVERDSPAADPVERCHAVGYPRFMERSSPAVVRDTADAYGYIPVLSQLASGLLTVQVSSSPRPLPPEGAAAPRRRRVGCQNSCGASELGFYPRRSCSFASYTSPCPARSHGLRCSPVATPRKTWRSWCCGTRSRYSGARSPVRSRTGPIAVCSLRWHDCCPGTYGLTGS